MYARIVTGQYQPGKIDEGLQIFHNSIRPSARMPLLAGAPAVEVYEVSIQEVQQGSPGRYARVLTATAQPGKTDEGVQIVRDAILPVTRQQPGYRGYLSLTDRTTGRVISITLWETEADVNASESSGLLREQLGKVAPMLATQVVREVYEVTVQE